MEALDLGHFPDSLARRRAIETPDVRNRQAIEEKLSYVEFLQRLIENDVERHAQKQFQLRRATFDPEKTFEGFDFAFNTSVHRQQIFDLVACHFVSASSDAGAGAGSEGLAGKTSSRRLTAGARMWYRTWWARGGGMSAARRSTSSIGSNVTCVVPSRQGWRSR